MGINDGVLAYYSLAEVQLRVTDRLHCANEHEDIECSREEAQTREQLQKLDSLKDLDLLETTCKILNIPMKVKKIWARRRLMPWFRANMTAWLYEYAKKHMSKHGRVYSVYRLDIGAGDFKRAFVTHRNAVTTALKRISRTSERDGRWKEEMLEEDLERNVTRETRSLTLLYTEGRRAEVLEDCF